MLLYHLCSNACFDVLLFRIGLGFATDERITFFDALQLGLGLQGGLVEVEEVLCPSIDGSKAIGTKVLLILDGLDFLLAATEANVEAVLDTIGELREHVHATIISATADYPLMQAYRTPVEINHAALIMGIAHQARTIWGVRELDTGSARDVSGVLRITRGAASEEDTALGEGENVEERELLYFIQGDGANGDSRNRLMVDNSEGYLVLRQTPQQNPYPLQTLRCVNSSCYLRLMYSDTEIYLSPSGRRSLHIQKHTCSSCGYPAAKIRQYNWGEKAKRRKTTGTGRMRTMKEVPRKFKNGFQTGAPKGSRGPANL
ncbi:MAG: hypothetical protein LQ341_000342 [Variospora aurantia]|nr:MAG: hypothetical protein LQ341_000342 [Variospora aurantia]